MRRFSLVLGLVALAAVLAACGGASTTGQPSPSTPGSPSAPAGDGVTIVAKDLTFKTPALTIAAGTATDVVFDNEDGAPHNIRISDGSGKELFKGDIVSSTKVTYHLPALAVGTYAFICEVHPDMRGQITVK